MRILALVASPREPNNDELYRSLGSSLEVEVVKLGKNEQKNLKNFLSWVDLSKYDRIILDLHFKRIVHQSSFIRTLNNLVIYEEDACQNYIQASKWYGKFLKFYKKLHSFRLVCTSKVLSEKFSNEGVDANFLPKAYDNSYLKNLGLKREIQYGFIGRIKSDVYKYRAEFLEELVQDIDLKLLRTEPREEYLNMLNKIKIFISADIGLGEYMIKNFEAMACGCLLIAHYQGGVEEEALGLRDMENIVLYKDKDELLLKLMTLLNCRGLIETIANAGQQLVV